VIQELRCLGPARDLERESRDATDAAVGRTGRDAGVAVGTTGSVSASLDETQIRSQSPTSGRRPLKTSVELDLFSGFALRVIDPGLHVVFRFVRD